MSKKRHKLETEYDANRIMKLEPRMHARKRPDLYLGGVGVEALHHLVDELLDSAILSVLVGKCDSIDVRLRNDNEVTVSDNDSLVPKWVSSSDYFERTGKHSIDWIFAVFAGLPFERHYEFNISGSWHGIGLNSVNSLTSKLSAIISRQNEVWKRTYREGVPHGALQHYTLNQAQPDGVSITFQPDFTIFEPNDFDYVWIHDRCQTLAYLFPQITISLADERDGQEQAEVLHYPDGIRAMVRDRTQGQIPRHEMLYTREIVTYPSRYGDATYDVIVEIALQYTDADTIDLHGYVNSVETPDGGTHIEGLHHALMGYINGASPNPLSWAQVARGLTAVIHILHPDPQFESNSSIKLLNPETFRAVESVMYPLLTSANLRGLNDCLIASILKLMELSQQ